MKTIVLFSGGADSTLCLAREITAGHDPVAVTIDYGQPQGELRAAVRIAGVLQERAELSHMLLRAKLPAGQRSRDGFSPDYMPGRNLMLLAMAAAALAGDVTLIIGAVADDVAGFPDCRPDFFRSAGAVLAFGLAKRVEVQAPLLTLTKAQIVASLTFKERQLLERSVSCYLGTGCGACNACLKRKDSGL